jgi:hypothetical protein
MSTRYPENPKGTQLLLSEQQLRFDLGHFVSATESVLDDLVDLLAELERDAYSHIMREEGLLDETDELGI